MHVRCRELGCAIAGRTILSDVGLDVGRGRMVALVGVNGSGKSTLLRTLAGLRPAAAGRVEIGGENLAELAPRHRARMLSYVGQEDSPPADLLVGEMVALGRIPHRPPWAVRGRDERGTVLDALAAVGLADAVDRRCEALSGGERRRVMLARGLAQGCDLLMLDEPTNHLDIHHQIRLLETIRDLGRTVVAVMHDLSLAATYFDEVAVLHDGGLLTVGTAAEALAPAVVRSVFQVPAAHLAHPETGREHLVLGPGAVPALVSAGKVSPC